MLKRELKTMTSATRLKNVNNNFRVPVGGEKSVPRHNLVVAVLKIPILMLSYGIN